MKKIPVSEFKFSFSRSSGAGGQNVNKLNTKVTLFWDIESSPSCSAGVKKRFTDKYKRLIIESTVVIKSQRFRAQSKNIDDCVDKLHELLASVEFAPKTRRPTKPTKGSVRKRLENKKNHSEKKKSRSQKF